jgi:hypothetical protein
MEGEEGERRRGGRKEEKKGGKFGGWWLKCWLTWVGWLGLLGFVAVLGIGPLFRRSNWFPQSAQQWQGGTLRFTPWILERQ